MNEKDVPKRKPGVCISWEEYSKERPVPPEGEAVARQIWEETDGLAYTYIWQVLLSF